MKAKLSKWEDACSRGDSAPSAHTPVNQHCFPIQMWGSAPRPLEPGLAAKLTPK